MNEIKPHDFGRGDRAIAERLWNPDDLLNEACL